MIRYVTLGECVVNGHLEDAAKHLRRATFHFMCGKPEWAAACITKANKDFERARKAYDFYSRDPFDAIMGMVR